MGTISAANFMKIAGQPYQTGKNQTPAIFAPQKSSETNLSAVDSREVLNVTKQIRKRVIVVSPFMAEDFAMAGKMVRYAEKCVRDSVSRVEAPVACHAFYYDVLNARNVIERDIGLHSQLSWILAAELVAIYVDYGVTPAMQVAIDVATAKGKKIEYRGIGGGI